MLKKIFRAGLIPLYIDPNNIDNSKMMFMVPSDTLYGGSDPQIAKGQIENGESAEEAALREAGEELGLRNSNIVRLFDCGSWLGRTHLFVAVVETDDPAQFDVPHFETRSVHWLTKAQFNESGRELHRSVVDNVFNLVTTTIEMESDDWDVK